MGVEVGLRLVAGQVSQQQWAQIYGETLSLLDAWPTPPLGIQQRHIAGSDIPVYTKDYLNPNDPTQGWRVVGDAHSRLRGESFDFPRVLPPYLVECPSSEAVDVAILEAREDPAHTIFRQKTQGQPYHHLIVAVATLVENRLPHVALAFGDIDGADGREAAKQLQALLGGTFDPPIITRPEQLAKRLESSLGEGAETTARQMCPPEYSSLLVDLIAGLAPTGPARKELEHAVSCSDAGSLSESTRDLFLRFSREITEKHGSAVPEGEFSREELLQLIVRGLRRDHVLTEFAWADIQAAETSELRLLATCAHVRGDLTAHQLVHALFESRAVRELVLRDQRDDMQST
ncbi:MAG: hypothetical protein ACRBN8_44845 [Nannocystales bacterium]